MITVATVVRVAIAVVAVIVSLLSLFSLLSRLSLSSFGLIVFTVVVNVLAAAVVHATAVFEMAVALTGVSFCVFVLSLLLLLSSSCC